MLHKYVLNLNNMFQKQERIRTFISRRNFLSSFENAYHNKFSYALL